MSRCEGTEFYAFSIVNYAAVGSSKSLPVDPHGEPTHMYDTGASVIMLPKGVINQTHEALQLPGIRH